MIPQNVMDDILEILIEHLEGKKWKLEKRKLRKLIRVTAYMKGRGSVRGLVN